MADSPEQKLGLAERWYPVLAIAVLALALFNLTFRLDREFVAEWDESLYAIGAWEAATRGSWLATTFLGEIDYYNTKPPLLIWLIGASFKLFGAGFVALRLPSIIAAWLTVAVLQHWTRRAFGAAPALLASLILSTMFGFLYVHSGRNATTDALFTLLMALTAVAVSNASRRPAAGVSIGVLLAATFLLRGMGVLLPLALLLAFVALRRPMPRMTLRSVSAAVILFAVPVSAWLIARYRVDGWAFLERLFMYDFIARTIRPIEEHPGSVFYYLDVLQSYHYDWIFAGVVALVLAPPPWPAVRASLRRLRAGSAPTAVLVTWGLVAIAVPTIVQTKVSWYLNPFYPVFAVGVGALLARSLSPERVPARWRRIAIATACVVALGVAEGKLLWNSYHRRDLSLSGQSLLLAERARLTGQRLLLEPHARASYFVATAMVGAQAWNVVGRRQLLTDSREGDYVLKVTPCNFGLMDTISTNGRRWLCRRRAGDPEIARRRDESY